jgi:PIN domain nuclease of toxin-antitoxin system
VRVLIDTHIFFWWTVGDNRLRSAYRTIIADSNSEVFVSSVTAWEISIKFNLGKWPEASPLLPDIQGHVDAFGFTSLPLTLLQAERAGSLPLIHRDPFDRMLAAQALDLDIQLMTEDTAIAQLGCLIV